MRGLAPEELPGDHLPDGALDPTGHLLRVLVEKDRDLLAGGDVGPVDEAAAMDHGMGLRFRHGRYPLCFIGYRFTYKRGMVAIRSLSVNKIFTQKMRFRGNPTCRKTRADDWHHADEINTVLSDRRLVILFSLTPFLVGDTIDHNRSQKFHWDLIDET